MNKLYSSIVTLSLLFLLSSAHAETYQLSDYLNASTNTQIKAVGVKGSFIDYFSFTASGSDSSYIATATNGNATLSLLGQTITINNAFHVANLAYQIVDDNYKSISNNILTAGSTYYLNVFGSADGALGNAGAYVITAAVPEPEIYALVTVGLFGLLVARRRKVMEK